jgi:hypothetical protein
VVIHITQCFVRCSRKLYSFKERRITNKNRPLHASTTRVRMHANAPHFAKERVVTAKRRVAWPEWCIAYSSIYAHLSLI